MITSKKIVLIICLLNYIYGQSQITIDTLVATGDKTAIIIQNQSIFSVRFDLSINQKFPLKLTNIMQSIQQIQLEEGVSDYIAAWKYVAENTFHTKPYTEENWQHAPMLFMNSIGGGFCDDRASVLARLWQKQGYQSRVITLNGHVVPELYVNGHWEMYDPDLFLYYEKDSAVLSVSELVDNAEIIKKGPLRGWKYASFYESDEDNSDDTDFYLGYNDWKHTFILPQFSELIIANDKGVPVIMVKLHKKSSGRLKIPFAPTSVTGKSVFITQYDTHRVTNKKSFVFNSDIPVTDLVIKEVSDETIVSYLTNPLLTIFDEVNEICISSNQPLVVKSSELKIKRIKHYKKYKLTLHKLKQPKKHP